MQDFSGQKSLMTFSFLTRCSQVAKGKSRPLGLISRGTPLMADPLKIELRQRKINLPRIICNSR